MTITIHKIGSFIPFNHLAFFCPVCGSNEFYDLHPYGGIWCGRCNAHFWVCSTCDGIGKLAIHVRTKDVSWQETPEDLRDFLKQVTHFWTVMWESDKTVSWCARMPGKKLSTVSKTDGELRMEKLLR